MLAQPRHKARSMKPFLIDKQTQVENDFLTFVELLFLYCEFAASCPDASGALTSSVSRA